MPDPKPLPPSDSAPTSWLDRHRDKLLPMVVSLPLSLQNLDTSILGPALPSMAASLHVDVLRLNLAVTAYLISLAIFLPVSGWLADRFGPRAVFCAAIALFSVASAACGLATSLPMLVACRVLQGLGGAMMVPVGRLILLRSTAPAAMVAAMVWFTVPPAIARTLGPLCGGLTVTYISWHWIFLMNVPVGLAAIAMAYRLVEAGGRGEQPRGFDLAGFALLGVGLASSLIALEGATAATLAAPVALLAGLGGLACLALYVLHERRAKEPLLDLSILRIQTFRTAVVGGVPLRLAIGATPFLMPLLLQIGFGLTPLQSGLITMSSAIGSLATRALLTRALRRFGFRRLLIGAALGASASYVIYAGFRADTPHLAIVLAMGFSGLVMSMTMVSMQTLAFTEIPRPLMGHATALSSMGQQLSLSFGVLLAVELLRLAMHHRDPLATLPLAADFPFAFLGIALIVPLSVLAFRKLPANAGAQLHGTGTDAPAD